VALDRLLAHVEAAGYLRVGEPVGDQLQHLEFPVGELAEDVRLVAPGPVQLPHHPRGDARVQDGFSGRGFADGVGELLGTYLLQHVR
jgi:hypothetical protein